MPLVGELSGKFMNQEFVKFLEIIWMCVCEYLFKNYVTNF